MANNAKVGRSPFWGPLLPRQEEGHCEALVDSVPEGHRRARVCLVRRRGTLIHSPAGTSRATAARRRSARAVLEGRLGCLKLSRDVPCRWLGEMQESLLLISPNNP